MAKKEARTYRLDIPVDTGYHTLVDKNIQGATTFAEEWCSVY